MASVLQTVFSLSVFRQRYYPSTSAHWETCTETLPASCVDCQMHKLADGLLSGRYSHPRPTSSGASRPKETNPLAHDSPTPIFQEGVRPSGFKALIGKGHEEFSTMRQQDSEEFFTHLLMVLRRHAKKTSGMPNHDPTEVFAFGMEQRLECGECHRVRYRVDGTDVVSVPVPARETGKDAEGRTQYAEVALGECLDILTGTEALEYMCPGCQKRVIATKYAAVFSSLCFLCRHLADIVRPQAIALRDVPAGAHGAREEVSARQLGADEARWGPLYVHVVLR